MSCLIFFFLFVSQGLKRWHLKKQGARYLVSCPSVDDRLDEDAQVLPGFPGLVALQADPQASRSRLVEGDFIHQMLPAVLKHQAPGLFAFLGNKRLEELLKTFPCFT